ncbi:MAG: glycosyltransferase [Alistipes sp.]|nr:glycosyltransferase [Alistipes sp.]
MIAIVTYSKYPDGSPGAIRYATFAQSYMAMGHKVAVLHVGESVDTGDVQLYSLYRSNRYARFLGFGYDACRVLGELDRLYMLEGIIIGSGILSIHAAYIQWWARCHNIRVVFDAVEWYSKEQFANWRVAMPYWDKELLYRVVVDKRSRVIAISSYLRDYFVSKGCRVVQIPIIYNPSATEQKIDVSGVREERLRLIYAGSHLRMDNISLILEALSLLADDEKSKVQFTIFGIAAESLRRSVPEVVYESAKSMLRIMGRRPNSEVVAAYADSDFTIMLRDPSLRVNRAGFPSKVVESMRMGVPVMCNYSSDLDLYLRHAENSIIIEELNAQKLCEVFRCAINLSKQERINLRMNAAETIATRLTYRQFVDELKYIIS